MTYHLIDRWGNVVFVGFLQAAREWTNARQQFAKLHNLPVPAFKLVPEREAR
jgi:hypothetical protein